MRDSYHGIGEASGVVSLPVSGFRMSAMGGKRIPVLYITSSAFMVQDRCPDAVIIGKPFRLSEVHEGVDRARSAV